MKGLESQGRAQWPRRNEKRAGQLARRDALPASVAPDTPLIACLRVGIRTFPLSVFRDVHCFKYILDISVDRNNQCSIGDWFSRQITIRKPQDSTRDSPSCLATVLGLRDVRTTTPYGPDRYHPLPTRNTPTGLGERYDASCPPSPDPPPKSILPIAMISLVALLALAEDIALIQEMWLTQFPCPRRLPERLFGKEISRNDVGKTWRVACGNCVLPNVMLPLSMSPKGTERRIIGCHVHSFRLSEE